MANALEKDPPEKCRLDKWLWAARFYKTRSLATEAIETGKIHVDGDRVKPAKEVRVGQVIHIRRKELEMEVVVKALSVTREADHARRERGAGRPTKRQRRDIKKFTGIDYF